MDKNAIKKFAIWARNELIAKVSQKAAAYGIEKDNIVDANADSIDGVMLSSVEKKQRKALLEQIKEKGYEQVIEEVAYTWFNRFTAIRFMEVNGYLPSHIRVFTDDNNNFKPQILTEAIHLNEVFEKINMEKVLELKQEDKTEELYKYLLIIQCNSLNAVLPRMFQKIEDYSELLLPDYLLREGSVLEQLITLIPEEDWQDQVQIIGWLYQYYNSEPKDAVFAALKKNVKISKENIPAATQLFTPDWIVRYMVENSLGRLWLEGHPNDDLKSEWKYYLDEAEQEKEVQKQLDEIRKEYVQLKPEEIKCIDPCMGSGHILCYMFDVLVKIYEDYGYTARDAASRIVENNIWGLDIDERAAQLSNFAVMMKARQYDRRFFTRGIHPHVYAVDESNGITLASIHDLGMELSEKEYSQAVLEIKRLVEEMYDAKEYGSIIDVTPCDWDLLRKFAVPRKSEDGQMMLDINGEVDAANRIQKLIDVGNTLSQKYHVVITNPPYMGASGMGDKLQKYIKDNYPDSKADIYSAFIEKNMKLSIRYISMITQSTWMFQSRFESIRKKLYGKLLVCMNHLGTRAFDEISGEVVQTTAFVYLNKPYICKFKSTFIKLTEYYGESAKENAFFDDNNYNYKDTGKFISIPGAPFAHYISEHAISDFEKGIPLKHKLIPKQGTSTGDDETFVRYWFEIDYTKIGFGYSSTEEAHDSDKIYFPIDKGGEYRKWYGNNDRVIRFDLNSFNTLLNMGNHLPSRQYYFKKGLTWSKIASELSVRYSPQGYIFSSVGLKGFPSDLDEKYILAFMNSKVCRYFVKVISPGMSIVSGDIEKLPLLYKCNDRINQLCLENIDISQKDWDSFENSWDFVAHPLIPSYEQLKENDNYSFISYNYDRWANSCVERYNKIKSNEEEINSIFIDIYGLSDEMDSKVDDGEITVYKADIKRDIKSLISYAVGCIFGRYSLDYEGIAYAGGDWDLSRYNRFIPDEDSIIPICDDEYFKDDITGRFISFIECVYGKNSLEKNLNYIADVIGGKGTSREIIRHYFINEFYKDHVKMYQKKPIYWLFNSGDKGGFKCLIYIHRYKPDTIARIRTDYVHEQQSRYRTAIENLEEAINKSTSSDRIKLSKQIKILQEKSNELKSYEELIHHLADQMIDIDLDKGIKRNYDIFSDVLARIK